MSWIPEVLAGLALAFWLLLALDRRRRWPRELGLLHPPGGAADPTPRVTAIVPARDEAAVIPETLPLLLAQERVDLRVLLVDDRSGDGTAEVAGRLARKAGLEKRLEVLRATPPPPGWAGKVHALSLGVGRLRETDAETEWLLFTDADIAHPPDSIAALLARARAGEQDLVSVMARLHARSFWERLLIPPFVFFFQLLYPFRSVALGKVAAAAGGCILLRRRALEAAGGLEVVRGALIDDLALARAIRGAGGSLWLGLDPEIHSVRPYRRLRDLWGMVSRSAFTQLRHSLALLLLVLAGLAILFVAPPLLALAAAAGLALGDAPARLALQGALLASVLTWALQFRALLPSVRHHRVPRVFAATLPLAALLYGLMTLTSAWNHLRGRGARWKGRAFGGPPKSPPVTSPSSPRSRGSGHPGGTR